MFDSLKRAFRKRPPSAEERLKRALEQLQDAWSLDAFMELQRLAGDGVAQAQYELGRHYEKALGVVQNLDDAVEWYERAAEQGHEAAQARAGLLLMSEPPPGTEALRFQQDLPRAAQWNLRAADAGDSGAQLRYGLQLAQGLGVDRDLDQARRWLQRSAEQDDVGGLTALGVLRAGVYGGEAHESEALELLGRAAESGDPDAQYWLGIVRGRSKSSDKGSAPAPGRPKASAPAPRSANWLEEAAEQGHVQAMYQLGLAHWSGNGAQADASLAETWLRRAASRDHVEAMRGLAQMLLERPDDDGIDASSLLWQAAEKGDQPSAALLAELFLQGRGVPTDPVEAARWLVRAGPHARTQAMTALANLQAHSGEDPQAGHQTAHSWLERASQAGDLSAVFTLGSLHYRGMGVPRDDQLALQFYQRVAQAGSSGAAFYLGVVHADETSPERDDKKALQWLRTAARRGHAAAVCNLASMAHQGRGQAPDASQASRILDAAASRGNLRAATMLSRWLSDGLHLARDIDRAHALLLPAIAMGDPDATAQLVKLHLEHGTPLDTDRAIEVLSSACESKSAGQRRSMSNADVPLALAQLLEASTAAGAHEHESRIRDLHERAAAAGSIDAQAWLALRLLREANDLRRPELRVQAFRSLASAARHGHVDALLSLDRLSAESPQVAKSIVLTPGERFQGWLTASLAGHAAAQRELAKCYLHGVGCAIDEAMAVRWLRRAAQSGDAPADALLKQTLNDGPEQVKHTRLPASKEGPPSDDLQRTTSWTGITRYQTPGFTRSEELIGPTIIDLPPPQGQQWFDAWSKPLFQRNFEAVRAVLSPVRAWFIQSATVSAEFVVHRENSVFLDSSMLIHQHRGRNQSEVMGQLTSLIDACEGNVDDRWRGEQVLVMHNEGGDTWGHFLVQNLPRMLLYLERFPQGKVALPAAHLDDLQQPGPVQLFQLLDIPFERLVPLEKRRRYEFKEVVLIDFLFDFEQSLAYPQAIRLVQRWLDSALARIPGAEAATERSSSACFIQRTPNAIGRQIANKNELAPILSRAGVDVVTLGQESVKDQISAWRSGRPMIATLGSDMSNMIFAPRGGRVLALTPDWFGDEFFYGLAQSCGIRWYELRCGRKTKPAVPEHRSSFAVDSKIMSEVLQEFCAAN